jgi:glutathione S-transferase
MKNKHWIMGDQYTVADPYALVFYGWGVRAGFPMTELSAYTAWKDRMLKRPTVKKILESEQNVLIKPA